MLHCAREEKNMSIHAEKSNKMQQYQNLLFHIYMKLNMFRATHGPASGAKNCNSGLWFCIIQWKVIGHVVAGRCQVENKVELLELPFRI
jgi:hypothetical protein